MRTIKLSEVNKDVKMVDGKLFIGKHEVMGRHLRPDKDDEIPSLYVIRVLNNGHQEFATGFDLVGNKLWLGGMQLSFYKNQQQVSLPSAYYDRIEPIEYIIENYSVLAGKEWAFFEEEDFEAHWKEYNSQKMDDCQD